MCGLLQKVGKLYRSDFFNLYNFSCSAKLIYSCLRYFESCNFHKNGNQNFLTSTNEISDTLKIFSPRMVRRQLNIFKSSQNLYHEFYRLSKSHINVSLIENTNDAFIFIVTSSVNSLQKASTAMILSLLLDKAAYNYRLGNSFRVKYTQMNEIVSTLGITKKTFLNALADLRNEGFVFSTEGNNVSQTVLYNKGFYFSEKIKESYSSIVSLVEPKNAQNTKQKKALSNVDKLFKNSKNSLDEIKDLVVNNFSIATYKDVVIAKVPYNISFINLSKERLKGRYLKAAKCWIYPKEHKVYIESAIENIYHHYYFNE